MLNGSFSLNKLLWFDDVVEVFDLECQKLGFSCGEGWARSSATCTRGQFPPLQVARGLARGGVIRGIPGETRRHHQSLYTWLALESQFTPRAALIDTSDMDSVGADGLIPLNLYSTGSLMSRGRDADLSGLGVVSSAAVSAGPARRKGNRMGMAAASLGMCDFHTRRPGLEGECDGCGEVRSCGGSRASWTRGEVAAKCISHLACTTQRH